MWKILIVFELTGTSAAPVMLDELSRWAGVTVALGTEPGDTTVTLTIDTEDIWLVDRVRRAVHEADPDAQQKHLSTIVVDPSSPDSFD